MAQGSARYERSAAGMVGAMVVTLLLILAFVAFRALNRDDLVVEPHAVDYTEIVQGLQSGGDLHPAYPEALPKGWIATRALFNADNLAWELDLLTDEGKYVGLRQAAVRDRDLLEDYGYEDVRPGETVGIDSAVATEWQTWTFKDRGEDTAYTTPLGLQRGDDPTPDSTFGTGETLLVFGGAPAADIRRFAALLVQDPLQR